MAVDRSTLRLNDLKARRHTATRLVSLKLPLDIIATIERLSKKLRSNKTEVVVALLNEGLALAQKKIAC